MSRSEIADDVWQFKLPLKYNPLGYTFSYYIADIGALIDAGEDSDEGRNALKRQLEKSGHKLMDIERLILTHLHRDHVGLVDYIKSASNVKICAHESAARGPKIDQNRRTLYENVRDETRSFGGSDFLGFLSRFEGSLRRSMATVNVDEGYADGEMLDPRKSSISVIWTPGHAPEHICLHDTEKRILYSGDHVLPVITSHVSLHTYEAGDPLRDYLESLDKLDRIDVEKVYPAHEHAFDNLKSRISELRAHHKSRAGEIMATLVDGDKTVFQIASKIRWKSRPWPLMPFWVKRMAAAETYAHLVFLKNNGKIREKAIDGILYYSQM